MGWVVLGTWHWTEWGEKTWLAVPWSLVVHSSIESSCRTYTTRKWEKWEYQRKRWAQDGAWRRQIWSKDEKSEQNYFAPPVNLDQWRIFQRQDGYKKVPNSKKTISFWNFIQWQAQTLFLRWIKKKLFGEVWSCKFMFFLGSSSNKMVLSNAFLTICEKQFSMLKVWKSENVQWCLYKVCTVSLQCVLASVATCY